MASDIIITESSYRKLQHDLEQMKTVKRAEIAEALRKARSYGDLSENFEYHAARREQSILQGQIAELEQMLEIASVVPDEMHTADGSACMGSAVMVHDLDNGDEWEYVLVDAVQADPVNDRISTTSPVGAELMGKHPGDEIEVKIPAGIARYRIISVRDA